ncbi:MAG: phage tail protein, partial [Pseudorhodobacter sp.]|nr:phage tail protein [Pseudorhodobacter sp.]
MMFAIALLLLLAGAGTANADPLSAAIGLLSGASGFAGGITVFGLATSSLTFRLLATVALSALSQAMAPKTKASGIQTSVTTTGGVTPASFILGRYATAGAAAAPAMSHGKAGKVPNAYLTYVIDLGDVPGQTLLRLMIDDEYAEIGTVADPDYGLPVGGRFTMAETGAVFAWVKYLDGSQIAADPMLLAKYGSYPERPWTTDMVGTGICQAIVTFRYNTEIFTSLPGVRFEIGGIPLYDPRLDTSVGGTGAMRWADRATWAGSDNPAVQIYNILRGISLPGGAIWGGEAAADDLPLGSWFAAMNECDLLIAMADTTTQPQYRSGFEVMIDAEPAGVIEELLKGCAGSVAESGGVWTIHVGAPALPVYFFDDGTVIVSKPQDLDPFPGLADTYNGLHASYPEPDSLWESKDAPPLYNATFEAADQGRQLVADLALPAVPYGDQVQRLMRAYIEEERRFARHVITLPPEALVLAPLDTVAWTSARNGYSAKLFEVVEVVDDLFTGLQQASLRERDPADYDWSSAFELPSSPGSGVLVVPAALAVPTFALTGITLDDATAVARRPALRLSWDGTALDGVPALEFEVRLAGTATVVQRGSTHSVEAGALVLADGILSATAYEARARLVIKRPKVWSGWATATTPNVLISSADVDFEDGITTLFEAQNMFAIRDVATLPTSGTRVGEKVFNRADGKLYEWTGTAWVLVYSGAAAADVAGQLTDAQIADIAAAKITGQVVAAQIADATLTTAEFAASIKPVEVLAALPGVPHVAGRMVFLTTDGKLYRNTGTGWTAAVPAVDVTGQMTDAQIADLAATKISGQLTAAQIASIASTQITGQMTNAQIADLAATKISGQLPDAQIADIAAAKITGQVVAAQIADATLTTAEF